jgi:hypothetical protein
MPKYRIIVPEQKVIVEADNYDQVESELMEYIEFTINHVSGWCDYNTTYSEWFERGGQHVCLANEDDELIIEFWDEAVTDEIEAGYLNPSNYKESLIDIANEHSITIANPWSIKPIIYRLYFDDDKYESGSSANLSQLTFLTQSGEYGNEWIMAYIKDGDDIIEELENTNTQ